MLKGTALLILSLQLLVACGVIRSSGRKKVVYPTPPGTIEIAENLYFDQTEITNFQYQELLFWVNRTYGRDSKEYLAALPDTSVWVQLDISYSAMKDYYLRHPAYRDYPVVGISLDQAQYYCRWRSDREMEYLLIKYDVIPFRLNSLADSAFTIEKYFAGQYYNTVPDPRLMYYPQYSLPDSVTYLLADIFADSLNAVNAKYCKKKYCQNDLQLENNCFNEAMVTGFEPYGPEPLKKVLCGYCKKPIIKHLQGNVRELTAAEGLFFGGSFMDSCQAVHAKFRHDLPATNSYTGFRNQCVYKKWGE